MDDLDAKIELLKPSGGKTNCFGTAFNLASAVRGAKDPEANLSNPAVIKQILSYQFVEVTEPKRGDLVLFIESVSGQIQHAGVLLQVDPMLMIHRANYKGSIRADNPKEFRLYGLYMDCFITFYQRKQASS